MANIYEVAAKHRAALQAGEKAAATRMVMAYSRAYAGITQELNQLTAVIEQKVAEGRVGIVPPVGGGLSAEQMGPYYSKALLTEQKRLRALQQQVATEMARFVDDAHGIILDSMDSATLAAIDHGKELLGVALGDVGDIRTRFQRLDPDAISQMVGSLVSESPLRSLLDELPSQAATRAKQQLVEGFARGIGPRDMARHMQDAMSLPLSRALRIARTETMRSYREATRTVYEANSDIVEGWVWTAAAQTRTCAACWAMHGTVHPLDARLDGHPNCRCTMVPATSTWESLGFGGIAETRAEVGSGAEQFQKLSKADQQRILGPSKWKAYADGEIELEDLVERTHSPEWGSMRRESSLKAAKERAKQRVEAQNAAKILDEQRKLEKLEADWDEAIATDKQLKKKEQTRLRVQRHRERQKALKEAEAAKLVEPTYPFGRLDELVPDNVESANLGGVHTKLVFRAPDGTTWLFKPQPEWRAKLNVGLGQLQKRSGLTTPDFFDVTIDGRRGSLQKMLANASERRVPFAKGFDPSLTDAQGLAQLQRHHAFDWLIGNHDAHGGQFIRKAGTRELIGVDKETAFKFWGKDRLDWDYNPIVIGDDNHIYNKLFAHYARGGDLQAPLKVTDDLRDFARTLQAIPDDDIRDLFRDYAYALRQAEGRGPGGLDPEDFLNQLVLRKNRLEADLEDYYARAEKARRKALEALKPKPIDPSKLKPTGMHTAVEHTDAQGYEYVKRTFMQPKGGKDVLRWANDEQRQVISNYKGSGYAPWNRALRQGQGDVPDSFKSGTRKMDSAFDETPVFDRDVIVWRGIEWDGLNGARPDLPDFGPRGASMSRRRDAELQERYLDGLEGRTFTDWGYISTSYGESPAFRTHPVHLKIKAPQGMPALSFGDSERELVLPRGVTYFIHKVEQQRDRYGDVRKTVVHVEVVGWRGSAAGSKTGPLRKRRPNKAPYKAKAENLHTMLQEGKLTWNQYQAAMDALRDELGKVGYTLADIQ